MNEAYCERLCIEQGRPEDAEELLALLRQVGSETDNLTFGAEGPAFTIEQEREYLRAMAENPTSAFFVARLDGRMVGSLSFRAMTLARASHRAEMGISVLQECWGKGVGNRLMKLPSTLRKTTQGWRSSRWRCGRTTPAPRRSTANTALRRSAVSPVFSRSMENGLISF